MSYKLTFDDGSSAYLAHYGTKGMKWGVWNAETAARYAGKSLEGGGGGGGDAVDEEETENERKERLAAEKQRELEAENERMRAMYSDNYAKKLMQEGKILESLSYMANSSDNSTDFFFKTGKTVVDIAVGAASDAGAEYREKQKAEAEEKAAKKQARREGVKNLQSRIVSEKNQKVSEANKK